MNGTNENKVDSLIAELRSFGDRPPPRFAWKRIADELEAAVKDEREDWEELQEITFKLLEHERAEANRRVEEIAAAAKHEREVLREAATSRMLEGATTIDYRGHCNAAVMHEALVRIHKLTNSLDEECGVDPVDIRDIARSALSTPPRQCDVGTAEEQKERFRVFCQTEKCGRHRCGSGSKSICIDKCAIEWAQMPYGEGESK